MNEKREKFEELAEKRMNDLVKKLQLLGNLSNRSNYDYTDDHVKQIITTLKQEVGLLEEKFFIANRNSGSTFRFKK